jgi:hypothetical protein
MSELELRLVELGRGLELPAEPDVAPAVLRRLEGRRPFPWRPMALAFALLAIVLAAAFAVPQARTAILRFFHVGGASVERVETLPPAVERAQARGLGVALSRPEAERRVGFRLALPSFEGEGPSRVYVLGDSVASVILRSEGRSVLLSEFRSSHPELLKKLVTGHTTVDPVRVGGAPGLWIQGAPHTLTYFDRRRGFQERAVLIHGSVLLWVRGGLTLRLEGRQAKAKALSLARRIR